MDITSVHKEWCPSLTLNNHDNYRLLKGTLYVVVVTHIPMASTMGVP